VTDARVVLLGKPGCHLCDDAREVVQQVCDDLDVRWSESSIEGDRDLESRYGEQIPVIFVDGRQHAIWRVDEERLRAALVG
jgi:glutaredoxin